jgi:hypothetical protein
MMATQTFSINSATGGQSQTSAAVLVGAGESVRVRFSSMTAGQVQAFRDALVTLLGVFD